MHIFALVLAFWAGSVQGWRVQNPTRPLVSNRWRRHEVGVPTIGMSDSATDPENDMAGSSQMESSWEPVLLSSNSSQQLWVGPAGSHTAAAAPPEAATAIYLEDEDSVFLTTTEGVLHWTTKQALSYLLEKDLSGRVLLDYGCGSGVLALAASALGAASAIGTDICDYSLQRAEENAQLNNAQDVTFVRCADLEKDMADMVVANMLPGPLLSVALDVARCVRTGGDLFLTGFRHDSEALIRAAFSPYFTLELWATGSAGWIAFVGRRNSAKLGYDALSAAAIG